MQAKIEVLKARNSSDEEYLVYPRTLTKCVTNENGESLDVVISNTIKDLIGDDTEISGGGVATGGNADTLDGHPASDFALSQGNVFLQSQIDDTTGEGDETIYVPINADLLGGHPVDYFATAEDLENLNVNLENVDGLVFAERESESTETDYYVPINAQLFEGYPASHFATIEDLENLSDSGSGSVSEEALTEILNEAKAYTDTEVADVLAETKAYTDTEVAEALAEAKAYTDANAGNSGSTGSSGGVIEGSECVASGSYAHAEGSKTTASGNYAHAEGYYTTASHAYSHAEGGFTTAKANYAHAEGDTTIASGIASHTEGQSTKASNNSAHAEGKQTTASGQYSHAEGYYSTASGYTSHAEGDSTTATYASHAEGYITKANGDYSHAEGYRTTASNCASHASGKLNKAMTDGGGEATQIGDVFVVGNGTATDALSNAFRVTYTGETYGLSAFNSSGADYAEFIYPWHDDNIENEDRIGYFVTFKDGKLYKATSKDIVLGVTSGNPSIVGNADEDYYWKYERDEFNRIVFEDVEEEIIKLDEDGSPICDENGNRIYEKTGNIIKNGRMKLNPDYDSSLQNDYIERKNRAEWDYVGMLGVLPARDDGTCVAGQYCKCNDEGIATLATAEDVMANRFTYIVLERVNDHVVKIVK